MSLSLKRPALPMQTIQDNEDLIFNHHVFLAFENPCYVGGISIFGIDDTKEFLIEYTPNHHSTILLEPASVPDLATDAEPFYMNYAAVLAYNRDQERVWLDQKHL